MRPALAYQAGRGQRRMHGAMASDRRSTTRWSGAYPGGGRAPISEQKNKAWHPVMMALSERFTIPFSDRYNIQLSERCQFPLSERYRIPLSEKESIPFSERSSTRTSDYALKRNIPSSNSSVRSVLPELSWLCTVPMGWK